MQTTSHQGGTIMRARLYPAGAALLACAGAVSLLAFARAQQSSDNAACMSNLKQMCLGLLMYVQDYDEKYPLMKTAVQLQPRLLPYVKNRAIFTCPVTKKPYQPNAGLSYKKLASFASPATTWALRDAQAHPDRMWTVGWLDGHVTRVKTLPGAPKKR
jgi:hypothetical protein